MQPCLSPQRKLNSPPRAGTCVVSDKPQVDLITAHSCRPVADAELQVEDMQVGVAWTGGSIISLSLSGDLNTLAPPIRDSAQISEQNCNAQPRLALVLAAHAPVKCVLQLRCHSPRAPNVHHARAQQDDQRTGRCRRQVPSETWL
jgi:hypothetical protein